MVSRTALFCATFFKRHILPANAHVKLASIAPWICSGELCSPNLQQSDSGFPPLNISCNNCFDADSGGHFRVLWSREDFFRRSALQYVPCAHDKHLIPESQGVNPVMSDQDCGNSQIAKQLSELA